MSYRTTSSITVVPAPARRSFDTGPGATGFPGPGHPGNAHLYRAEPGFTAGSHDLGALQGLGTVTGRPPPPAYLTLDDSSEENGPVFAPSRTWASTRVFPADNALLQQAGQLSQRLADILARMERGDSLATVVRFERMLQDLGLRVTAEQINGPLALSSGPRNLDVAPERPLELMLPPKKKYKAETPLPQEPVQMQMPAQPAQPAQPERPVSLQGESFPEPASPPMSAPRRLFWRDAVAATASVRPAPEGQAAVMSGFSGPGWETALQRYQPPTADMSPLQREILVILNARAATPFSIQTIQRCIPDGRGEITVQALLRSEVLKGMSKGDLIRTPKQVRLEDVMKAVEYEDLIHRVTQAATATAPGQAPGRSATQPQVELPPTRGPGQAGRRVAPAVVAGEEPAGGPVTRSAPRPRKKR